MSFSGYEYTYKLNILHSFDMSGEGKGKHQHTLDIKIHMRRDSITTDCSGDSDFKSYDSIENDIREFFEPYNGSYVNDIPPFDKTVPTIEALGEFFYDRLNEIFEVESFKIYKVEISEIPSRVYVISDFLKTGEVKPDSLKREMNIAKYINATSRYLDFYINYAEHFGNDESEENASVSVVNDAEENNAASTDSENIEDDNRTARLKVWQYTVLGSCAAVLTSIIVWFILCLSGSFPMGKEVYEHLALSDYLYKSISDGNLFPVIFDNWYAGYAMFSTTAPLAYYVMALFQGMSGGDAIQSYVLFLSVFAGAGCFGWYLNGIDRKRYWAGMAAGIIWTFIPSNLNVIAVDGRVPYVIIIALLPYLIFVTRRFINTCKARYCVFQVLIAVVMLLTDVFPALITIFAMIIVTMVMGISYRKSVGTIIAMFTLLFSVGLTAFWLVPAYASGLADTFVVAECNVNIIVWALMIIIACVCIFISLPYTKYAYMLMFVFGLLAIASRGDFVDSVPMGRYLFSGYYALIAAAGLLLGTLEWNRAKNYVVAIVLVLIAACCLPALVSNIEWSSDSSSLYDNEVEVIRDNGLEAAVKNTEDRLFIADFEDDRIFPAYYASANGKKVSFAANLDKKSPAIRPIVEQMNYAVYCNQFSYLFDRAIEGGYDTVAVSKQDLMQSTKEEAVEEALIRAEEQLSYEEYEEFYQEWLAKDEDSLYVDSEFARMINEGTTEVEYTDEYRKIVRNKTEESWEQDLADITSKMIKTAGGYSYSEISDDGDYYVFRNSVIAGKAIARKYKGIAIGENAGMIARLFPYFEEASSSSLDSYSVDYLKQYEKVLLLGVRFDSKTEAEDKVNELVAAGVDVYIDMSDIQADKISGKRTFMGVTAQDVHFDNGYEYLIYKDDIYETTKFDYLEQGWDTVYLEGLEESYGYSWLGGERVSFAGKTNNVHFLGFDLIYYTVELQDRSAEQIMSGIMGLEVGCKADYSIVDIDIKNDKNQLVISTASDSVITGLGKASLYQGEFDVQNGLITVNSGSTLIDKQSIYDIWAIVLTYIVTVCGFACVILVSIITKKRNSRLGEAK